MYPVQPVLGEAERSLPAMLAIPGQSRREALHHVAPLLLVGWSSWPVTLVDVDMHIRYKVWSS